MNCRGISYGFALFVTAAALAFAANPAPAQTWVARPVAQSIWPGFGSDFQPQWLGDTKRIDWPTGGGGGGSNGTLDVNISNPSPTPIPIGLIGTSREFKVETKASVQGVHAAVTEGTMGRGDGPWNVGIARFAEVLNLEDELLDRGAAVAELRSEVRHNAFSVSGRVSAAATMHPSVAGNGGALALGKSSFIATYAVSQSPVWFELAGSLSGVGSLAATFSLSDDVTKETLYSLTPAANGVTRRFSLSGTLEPGMYSFSISTIAEGSVGYDPAASATGMGEYSLSFLASPRRLGDANGDGSVNSADLGAWKTGFGFLQNADLNGDGSADGHDFLDWQRDPISQLFREWGDQRRDAWRAGFGRLGGGDADGDRDTDGADFLLWQRKLGASSTVAATAAVPEPAASLLLLALSAIPAAGRRTFRRATIR